MNVATAAASEHVMATRDITSRGVIRAPAPGPALICFRVAATRTPEVAGLFRPFCCRLLDVVLPGRLPRPFAQLIGHCCAEPVPPPQITLDALACGVLSGGEEGHARAIFPLVCGQVSPLLA